RDARGDAGATPSSSRSPGGRFMKIARPLVAALVLVLAVTAASAQATGGVQSRGIGNSDKSPLLGGAGTLEKAQGCLKATTIVTDAKGEALFPVLRPGQVYSVDVILDGYAHIRQDLRCDTTIKDVPIALAPEQVEKVTVIGKKTTVDLDNNEQSTKFSNE